MKPERRPDHATQSRNIAREDGIRGSGAAHSPSPTSNRSSSFPSAIKKTPKYAQIVASIREVGIVEPPVVARDRSEPGKYLLLDGHLRIEVLKDMGETEVTCLISTDDEAFTYNKRVNRLAIIQEHRMILKAVERGVPEERIAKALNVDVQSIRRKRRLLDGICPEVAEILKDKHIAIQYLHGTQKNGAVAADRGRGADGRDEQVHDQLRQIAACRDTTSAICRGRQAQARKGLSDEQVALMERESVNLEREFRIAEKSYGTDHLDLVLTNGYLGKLLGNARVVRYLAQHHSDILTEFQKLAEMETVAA